MEERNLKRGRNDFDFEEEEIGRSNLHILQYQTQNRSPTVEPVITFNPSSQQILQVHGNKSTKRLRVESQPKGPTNDISNGINNLKLFRMKLAKDMEEAYRKNIRLKVCNCIDVKVDVPRQSNNMLLFATLRILVDKVQ